MRLFKAIWNNSYITGILIVLFLVIDIVIVGQKYDLSKSDWSGWVQAIGSIGAIFCAIWIASSQRQNEVRRESKATALRKFERNQSVVLVIDHCFSVLYSLPDNRKDIEIYELHKKTVPRSTFKNLHELLRAAPLYEVA